MTAWNLRSKKKKTHSDCRHLVYRKHVEAFQGVAEENVQRRSQTGYKYCHDKHEKAYFLTRFGTKPGKSRLSRLFYRLFCQIFLWCEVSQPAWINISAAPSCRKCQSCCIFTISGSVVEGNRVMCTHCVDENTELLEVGSRSVKQGSNTFAKCDILH